MKLSTIILVTTSVLLSGTAATSFDSAEVCRKQCYRSKHHCPKGWYAKKMNRCWTCCRKSKADYVDDDYDYEYDYEVFEWE
ncbi:hypothetical protein ANOM_011735 [Aspergillus nomiae NRRL 13137]|uniref:Uncharacterized protein n=1 Tax=Aspergillus nomiae NRRL (strain ATCC 15546 / NRRL 13137 / CBS 260.88 / M93) TaxID=1509407 RepID=A0A0L1ILF3_ASPN3|nr:uncharacterized protein ANOM_011735 [Aspergillus nomiae NRRL 13137]KNG80404.1 hypothetical protein ANOM_011735 [Aspergillus nomiae NRRL 13137]